MPVNEGQNWPDGGSAVHSRNGLEALSKPAVVRRKGKERDLVFYAFNHYVDFWIKPGTRLEGDGYCIHPSEAVAVPELHTTSARKRG